MKIYVKQFISCLYPILLKRGEEYVKYRSGSVYPTLVYGSGQSDDVRNYAQCNFWGGQVEAVKSLKNCFKFSESEIVTKMTYVTNQDQNVILLSK